MTDAERPTPAPDPAPPAGDGAPSPAARSPIGFHERPEPDDLRRAYAERSGIDADELIGVLARQTMMARIIVVLMAVEFIAAIFVVPMMASMRTGPVVASVETWIVVGVVCSQAMALPPLLLPLVEPARRALFAPASPPPPTGWRIAAAIAVLLPVGVVVDHLAGRVILGSVTANAWVVDLRTMLVVASLPAYGVAGLMANWWAERLRDGVRLLDDGKARPLRQSTAVLVLCGVLLPLAPIGVAGGFGNVAQAAGDLRRLLTGESRRDRLARLHGCTNCGQDVRGVPPGEPCPSCGAEVERRCVGCGYDVRGFAEGHPCPECGQPVLPAGSLTRLTALAGVATEDLRARLGRLVVIAWLQVALLLLGIGSIILTIFLSARGGAWGIVAENHVETLMRALVAIIMLDVVLVPAVVLWIARPLWRAGRRPNARDFAWVAWTLAGANLLMGSILAVELLLPMAAATIGLGLSGYVMMAFPAISAAIVPALTARRIGRAQYAVGGPEPARSSVSLVVLVLICLLCAPIAAVAVVTAFDDLRRVSTSLRRWIDEQTFELDARREAAGAGDG